MIPKNNMPFLSSKIEYSVALNSVEGVGSTMFKKLIDEFKSASVFFELSIRDLEKILKEKKPLFIKLKKDRSLLLEKAKNEVAKHKEASIEIFPYESPKYPKLLKNINNPPPLIYLNRPINLNKKRIVSIVGTRNPTSDGLKATEQLIQQLISYEVTIISGLARGIDSMAHQVAQQFNIPTVGIVASGLNRVYPKENYNLINTSLEDSGLISEYPLYTEPTPYRFPARNRIIAAISHATIVVEAPKKSGALITAYCANEYNREVFAVPGSIYSKAYQGCNNLIKKQQAHLLSSIEDLAYIMNWTHRESKKSSYQLIKKQHQLSPLETQIIKKLIDSKKNLTQQQLLTFCNATATEMASTLLNLELKEIISLTSANKYSISKNDIK